MFIPSSNLSPFASFLSFVTLKLQLSFSGKTTLISSATGLSTETRANFSISTKSSIKPISEAPTVLYDGAHDPAMLTFSSLPMSDV
ncbi:hypothetical protein HanIR_Chr14g0706451 [Helianthus annuus]|nr:hypothetical protein HanIR_Chr14g0706451 [Helianthus annuus]